MRQIERNQAEVSRCVVSIVEDDQVLMTGGPGFQFQVIWVAVHRVVFMIGMVAVETFHGYRGGAHRLAPRTFDHGAVFAQSLAIKSQHLIAIVSRTVVGHLHPQLERAEPHVDVGRLVPVVARVHHRPGIGRETKRGSGRLVFINGESCRRGGDRCTGAIVGLVHAYLTTGSARDQHSEQSKDDYAVFHVFSSHGVRAAALPCSRKLENVELAKLRLSPACCISEQGRQSCLFSYRGCPVPKSLLFSPIQLAGVTFPNRVFVSPMCQYSSQDGFSNDWHLVHLGSRAVGGAGLVFTEAAAVLPEGRISPQDLGLWKDDHIAGLKRIVEFIHAQGARAGVQLAHAGRKASMARPWAPEQRYLTPAEGGWKNVVAPSAVPFADNYAQPIALDLAGIQTITRAFARAAERALEAGFDLVELHSAHGYLLHEFLSPLSNRRNDQYGGQFENRIRLLVEVVDTVRAILPAKVPLLVRISATDWAEGGWDIEQSVALARVLKEHKVDLVDVSSGGMAARAVMTVGSGYQTPFADRIRREAKIPTGAVGMITAAAQAEHILRAGQADIVLLARELLREPY